MRNTLIQRDGVVIANGKKYKVPKGGANVLQSKDGLIINGEVVEKYSQKHENTESLSTTERVVAWACAAILFTAILSGAGVI